MVGGSGGQRGWWSKGVVVGKGDLVRRNAHAGHHWPAHSIPGFACWGVRLLADLPGDVIVASLA